MTESTAPSKQRRQKGARRLLASIVIAALVLGALVGGALWRFRLSRTANVSAAAMMSAIPVTIATAASRDVPIYRPGLGSVQAFNTIAIHTQVDGKLQSVNFVEGKEVHKGDVLAQIDPRYFQAALDQAKGKKIEDEAQLVSAEKDLKRINALLAKRFETPQDRDHQTALVDQFKAAIEADQAAIEGAQVQLDYTTIRAPVDGRTGIRQVDPGNIVHTTDTTPIVVVTQMRPISIIFTLPESDLADVRQAMGRGPVSVQASDQNDLQRLGTGKLLLIDNEIDQSTSTIRLKAIFPNHDEILWPGESVHTRILVETRLHAVTIPSTAVQRGPQGLYAWIVRRDNVAELRPISVGPMQGGVSIITSGVSAGEQVVVDGQYRLQPGSLVTINAAPVAVAKGMAS